MIFILIALLEYAFILFYKRSFPKGVSDHKSDVKKKGLKENSKELSRMLDQMMLITCPFVFMFFCVIFWSVMYYKA